ncbi:hydantoinase/oxoprolinase family protein [Leucobacter sp. cx-328]|uniref:hydantoinase/oxoprolinase family protein n=1 Tax=unclassified Leucobacter TaxID=2621730 RepID=UPI00165E42B8|nr:MULTISPECIES: hydantoinase/oxoprolinase family protein [unclassified Leucobacter]MBC9942963.1 hydantoinase/oxoprolinase family protein [Leucobacter sp. cx-328]MBC9953527.1 hydantoinase/oxoprolinase family protein [Leucobacter sp. cx-42]
MSQILTGTDEARYRIAVDTGGTFTDVVVGSSLGGIAVGKALTTYDRVFTGFEASVRRAAESVGWDSDTVLRNADVIVYGTTHATNAVLTGKVAKTALLTTAGFADTLLLREGGRREAFDSKAAYPPAYIPRNQTFEITERLSAEGEVIVPLDEERTREVLRTLAADGTEAIAVGFLWSIINDAHERRVGELIEEELPGIPYTLSNEANPTIREYRRTSAAAIDASLKPLMAAHLGNLRADLLECGFSGDLLVVTSEGAVLDVADVLNRPVLLLNSGPSMAPLVGAAAAPDRDTVVVCDMGGTTFDVSLVENGLVRHTREAWLGEPFVGHLTGLSSVAVTSIGAGGGSIAWIDNGGLLRVGPQSARSIPGPAAYGRGGEEPTVTDACVALGYLDAQGFEGGFVLDREAATRAIESRISGALGRDALQSAQAILDVSANHMATAIRQSSLEQGVDPRGALIVAGGGAGAMVAAAIGALLEADTVLIPATAGVLAAYGAHRAPIATEFLSPLHNDTRAFDVKSAAEALRDLSGKAAGFADRFRGTDAAISYFVDARYPGQAWDLRVILDEAPAAELAAEIVEQAFHVEHDRRNGTHDPDSRVEIITWGVRVEIPRPELAAHTSSSVSTPEVHRTDDIVFGGKSYSTARYRGVTLSPGERISGPAVIDQPTTTIVVPPEWDAQLDDRSNIYLTRKEA